MASQENPHAFPVSNDANVNGDTGMTLRDYFAGQFIMGWRHSSVTHSHEQIATEAYRTADAMLAVREQAA